MNKLNFSYASKVEHNFAQRLVIRLIENLTETKIRKLYRNYTLSSKGPRLLSDVLKLMKIKVIDKSAESLSIPETGSLMIIANHPFGIVDGLILCSLVSKIRKDFKIMTHETLKFLPELEDFILPVDFSNNKKNKVKKNIEIAKKAKNHLLNKGVLIIFPSGSVSTAKSLKSEATDDTWKTFPAKLIHQTKTNVIPIYFDGKMECFSIFLLLN